MESMGWGAIVLAAITMLKNIADSIVSWLSKKDQLANDVKVALLEQNHKRCEESTQKVEKALDECNKKHEIAEKKQDELETEVKDLRQEVMKTVSRVDNKMDKATTASKTHKPLGGGQ